MIGNQIALDFAVEEIHGSITIQFSRGRRPVRCLLMAADLKWYDGDGESVSEAVGAAIDKSGCDSLRDLWSKFMG